MKLSEETRFNVTLGLLLLILGGVTHGTWLVATMSTKMDVLWREAGHSADHPAAVSTPLLTKE